jgi:starch-binding outer membrane protein, SusD/RagB family
MNPTYMGGVMPMPARREVRGIHQRGMVVALALSVAVLTGCESLLEVEVPGAVTAESLDNPQMAASLLAGAIGEVECAVGQYVEGTAILADEVISSSFWRNYNVWGAKLEELNTWTGPCQTSVDSSNLGFYLALSRARFMTDDAFERIGAFDEADLPLDKTQAQAQLAAYAGYTLTMLGEGFCEAAIAGGPALPPSGVLELADERFATALILAAQAGDESLLNTARVGRARVLLNLGRDAEAAELARQVPEGFSRDATYSTVTGRRHNRVWVNSTRNRYLSVAPAYRGLTIDGEMDTRVESTDTGEVGHDNFTELFLQTKYPTASSPIPLASWREARLILAEAELGQSAVDRINELRAFHGLPMYSPSSLDDATILAQVLEERSRELFLEGHRLNDMLRHDLPFPTGRNHKDEPYGPTTCMPLPNVERFSNPNITG